MNKLLALIALALSIPTIAQEETPEETGPQHYAQQRVEVYANALGLTEEQQLQLEKLFTIGESEAAELRAKCREAQEGVERIMTKQDAEAEKLLTKDQVAQLANLRKSGTFDPEIPSCMAMACGKGCCTKEKPAGKNVASPTPTLQKQSTPELIAPE
jgi:hypothetical protein